MTERYRPLFLTILSLTVLWLIIILLYLPKDLEDVSEQWTASSSPLKINNLHQHQEEGLATFQSPPIQQDESTLTSNNYDIKDIKLGHNHIKPPDTLGFMRYFHNKRNKTLLSKIDTLFYEFNPEESKENFILNDSNSSLLVISKKQHDQESIKLNTIRSPLDQYIRNEGNKLFAFNLLASNRIGLIRPLPDTRNSKCPRILAIEAHASNPTLATKTISKIATISSDNVTLQSTSLETEAKTLSESVNLTTSHSVDSVSKSNSLIIKNVISLKASIVICYYNEAPSALLRTIYTVLKRSPIHLIEEIIIVDDFSNLEYHFDTFKSFINTNLVKLVRTAKREGLIRARLFGAKLAKGDVLIFLDSHVEANQGWLEPLLQVVQENKTTIACPMIDLINAETLIYSSSPMVKGGLNWSLNFKWDSVPSSRLMTYDDFIRPIESPTMAGGLYAIDRRFFHQLGAYDTGMELWGGENVEMSLRIWMCGGKILILPCSRLGHIFRKRRPYGPEPDQPDSLLINTHRTARVWLDEYIDKFYESSPDARYLVSGDISQRLEIKHKLKCHNFSWFLDNIYPNLKKGIENSHILLQSSIKPKPNLFSHSPRLDKDTRWFYDKSATLSRNNRLQRQVPHVYREFEKFEGNLKSDSTSHKRFFNSRAGYLPKLISQFQIQSSGSNFCIESRGAFLTKGFTRLVLNHCAEIRRNVDGEILIHNSSILDQLWTETELHDYRLGDNQCLDLIKNLPLLRKCHNMGTFQAWSHDDETKDSNIYNSGGLCLGVERVQAGEPIIVTLCDKQNSKRHIVTRNTTKLKKRSHKSRILDRVFPNWLTGSTLRGGRFRDFAMNPLRPSQEWNLIFVNNSLNNHSSRLENN